jgi:hypothetical protein
MGAPTLWFLDFYFRDPLNPVPFPTGRKVKTSTGYLLHHKWCNIVTSD